MPTREEIRSAFRDLHREGCFVIPNPWDLGSVKILQAMGFKALASTSSGFAFTLAQPDSGALPRDTVLDHLRDLAGASDLPINADYMSGYGATLEELSVSVTACVGTGVAGLSIEDSTGDGAQPLFDLVEAKERMQAARAAIDGTGEDVMLIGRAECFLVGHPSPLDESVRRLQAYSHAGADVLFAPGIKSRADIETLVRALAPKPVNVLVSGVTEFRLTDYAEMGVRRISVGSALARAAWGGFVRAARELEQGGFNWLSEAASFAELRGLFT